MLMRCIGTHEYDADIEKLLVRRLTQTGYSFTMQRQGNDIIVCMEDEGAGAMDALCTAVSLLLGRDLKHFELARMVNHLPLSLIEKQAVLSETIKAARSSEQLTGIKRSLKEYLSANESLNLEGFMHFRMKETRNAWHLCMQRATEELLLQKEYIELMSILRGFVQIQPPRIGEVSVCLNPDGSCTLTDDSDYRIDYKGCTEDCLVSVLIGLAPERLTVYDLTDGSRDNLTESLARVFAGRIRFFH